MKSLLQRPPDWLWKALGVVRGTNPSNLDHDIAPVVDAVQKGWSVVEWEQTVVNGSLVGGTTTQISAPADKTYRVKISHYNPGTANVTVQVRLGFGGLVPLWVYANNTVPSGVLTMVQIGEPWIDIPPGFTLEISQTVFTTTAGYLSYIVAKLPAGVSLT